MDNFDAWVMDLRAAEQRLVPGELLKLQRKLVFLTLGAAVEIAPGRFRKISGVVLLTPVDTGRTRSAWNVSVGEPDTSWPQGQFTPRRVGSSGGSLRSLGAYQTVWITNSVPWIKVLEYGGYPQNPVRGSWDSRKKEWVIKTVGGYSRQAPRGMVRITVEGIRAALAM